MQRFTRLISHPAIVRSVRCRAYHIPQRHFSFSRTVFATAPSDSVIEKARASFDRAIELWNNGDADGAQQAFDESLVHHPSADAYYNLGNCLLSMNEFDGALNAWEKSIELDPHRVDAHVNLANVLVLNKKMPEKAVEHYKKAIALNPNDGEVQFNFGCVQDSLQNLEGAIEQYENALKNGITAAEKNLRNAKAKLIAQKIKETEKA